MRVALAVLPTMLFCAAQHAMADNVETIAFSFAAVSFQPPGTVPGTVDNVGPITDTFTVPASPTVLPPPVPSPGEFWVNPAWSGTPGTYPPPGSKDYIFGQDSVAFVFADDVPYPLAYSYFQTQGTLFTGPVSGPTFVPGVYSAQYAVPMFGYGYDPGTITIAAAAGATGTAPEPDSLLLSLSGMAAAGVVWICRRRHPPRQLAQVQ